MALPKLQYRGDITMAVDWNALENGPYDFSKKLCGAKSISISVDNEIREETVADCDDWSLPPVKLTEYGAQSWSVTVNAAMTVGNRDKLLKAAKEQHLLPIRFHIVTAQSGETEFIDGVALLPTLTIDNIGAEEKQAITATINLRLKSGATLTPKA